ncbi:hypothetical protein G5714_015696 [Onychostoma macrolepis]|uniref:FXYD domain-containing ion transport regulator n=1 Tax=Onychostoma macrolepis TaxID=369639 RepID=A0A7J6C7Y2_9TELE|nr:hypothetical protein G5714_015696 [Onychostoma macrolepis]
MASRLQGPCVVSEIEKALSYKPKAFRDNSITRGGGRANFPKHLQAFKDPFVYNYEALRIGGLIFTALLVAGGVGVLCWGQCKPKRKNEDASKI